MPPQVHCQLIRVDSTTTNGPCQHNWMAHSWREAWNLVGRVASSLRRFNCHHLPSSCSFWISTMVKRCAVASDTSHCHKCLGEYRFVGLSCLGHLLRRPTMALLGCQLAPHVRSLPSFAAWLATVGNHSQLTPSMPHACYCESWRIELRRWSSGGAADLAIQDHSVRYSRA